MKKIKSIKIGAIALSVALTVTALGFGCGIGFQPTGFNSAASTIGGLASDIGENGNLVIVSGKKTISTVYYDEVLDNMNSVTGVQNNSNETRQRFNEKIGSFSEFGSALSINAPMILGFTALGAEVCGDLIVQERGQAMNARRMYASVDFTQNAANTINDASVSDVVRRMARSYWQRNETSEELDMIKTSVNAMLADATDNNSNVNFRGANQNRGTLRASLYICTAMLASTSAFEL